MTPESAIGRLVNLRETLLADRDAMNAFVADRIDDLDDIIKCIKRGMQEKFLLGRLEPDSEDMEARKKHDDMLPHGCNDPECEFKPDSEDMEAR